MTDRTKDELREFLNSQLHLKPEDRDWTLTEGEQHILVVGIKVVMLNASKLADEEERRKKNMQAFHWAWLMSNHCPGFTKYFEENKRKILDEAAEIFEASEENIA